MDPVAYRICDYVFNILSGQAFNHLANMVLSSLIQWHLTAYKAEQQEWGKHTVNMGRLQKKWQQTKGFRTWKGSNKEEIIPYIFYCQL